MGATSISPSDLSTMLSLREWLRLCDFHDKRKRAAGKSDPAKFDVLKIVRSEVDPLDLRITAMDENNICNTIALYGSRPSV